ncbi:unnamed protein product [Parnassius apollo]|uniref:(apollo) hypothetical protein n=1 Tax=Parnassius apollo TaxID=110799 RepID=A0A8S3Y970_PARAO|nr:unnamed protein product [Parnassius apollo]
MTLNPDSMDGSNSKDGCELDSEKLKPVLPANVICDIPINILKETDDSISFVIPKGALMPSDCISDKGEDISPFVSSSNEVDNLLKERDILDGSNNIALSLEKLKQPLSEDFHDTNITPEGKVKSPKGVVIAKDINGKRNLRKRDKCLGFYSIKEQPSHLIECDYTLSTINAQVKKQKSFLRHFKVDNNLKNIVFPLMESDTISLIAQKDKIICMFGVHYFKKYGETHSVMTSHKMRDLAKLLVEVNKLKPKISCLEEVLKPQYYRTLVDASKNVIQYNKKETQFEALSYVLNIANLLKYCCRIAISESSKLLETPESVKFKEDMKSLILQINRNWRQDIATLVHCSDNSDSD